MVGWKYIKNSLQSYDNSVNKDRPCIRHFSKAAAPHNELKIRMLKMIQQHCQGMLDSPVSGNGKEQAFFIFSGASPDVLSYLPFPEAYARKGLFFRHAAVRWYPAD